jgi:hypothetical protein
MNYVLCEILNRCWVLKLTRLARRHRLLFLFLRKAVRSVSDIDNYRSIVIFLAYFLVISILGRFSTVFPTFISPDLHYFMKGWSAHTSMGSDLLMDSIEVGFQIDVVYTDFSKAIDKLSHWLKLKWNEDFYGILLSWRISLTVSSLCTLIVLLRQEPKTRDLMPFFFQCHRWCSMMAMVFKCCWSLKNVNDIKWFLFLSFVSTRNSSDCNYWYRN